MKMNIFPFAGYVLTNLVALHVLAGEPTSLAAKRSNAGLEFSWPATMQRTKGSVVRPYFELQHTFDFQR